MASAFDPAASQLAWKGFADGGRVAQPGAVPIYNKENKYKAYAAKAIGEMAYGGFTNWMDKRKAEEEKIQKRNEFSNISAMENQSQMEMEAYGMPRNQFEKSIAQNNQKPLVIDEKNSIKEIEKTPLATFDTSQPPGPPISFVRNGVQGTYTYFPATVKPGSKGGGQGGWKWKEDKVETPAFNESIIGSILYYDINGKPILAK